MRKKFFTKTGIFSLVGPVLFAAVLLAAVAADKLGWKTELGAHLYFWARLIYLPLYAAGIPKLRTLVWLTSLAGVVLVLSALLMG